MRQGRQRLHAAPEAPHSDNAPSGLPESLLRPTTAAPAGWAGRLLTEGGRRWSHCRRLSRRRAGGGASRGLGGPPNPIVWIVLEDRAVELLFLSLRVLPTPRGQMLSERRRHRRTVRARLLKLQRLCRLDFEPLGNGMSRGDGGGGVLALAPDLRVGAFPPSGGRVLQLRLLRDKLLYMAERSTRFGITSVCSSCAPVRGEVRWSCGHLVMAPPS
ncbi:hypothetical protein AB1Y20_010149 [Prymnesium parvum]|uniref:Uncharacterized protein n=1 Tax=Prymnesium parvum TaxID=97485 RepID=A0AB34K7H9_PRYPA